MIRIKPLSVMIIGENAEQFGIIQNLIQTRNDLELYGSFIDPDLANKEARKIECNIFFLDLNNDASLMKKTAKDLNNHSVMIIFSATDKFALEAFDAGAIDYLVKPVLQERFNQSVERAKKYLSRHKEKISDTYDIMEKFNIFYDRLQNEFHLKDNYFEICKLIIKDKNRKEIMDFLNITENTLKVYLREIYSKTIELDENIPGQRKNKFHQLYLFLCREFDKNTL